MKDVLRKKYQEIRRNIVDKEGKDKRICEKFLRANIYQNSEIILAYYPLDEEVNIKPIILQALKDNKKVALPITIDKEGNMEFYFINSLNNLALGNFGIMEPKNSSKVTNFDKAVIIVPGIVFDYKGFRLGFGKGYYDRYLNTHSILSVGICYQECMIKELVVDKFDKKIDIIFADN